MYSSGGTRVLEYPDTQCSTGTPRRHRGLQAWAARRTRLGVFFLSPASCRWTSLRLPRHYFKQEQLSTYAYVILTAVGQRDCRRYCGFRGCLRAVGEVNTMGQRGWVNRNLDTTCCCLILVGLAIGGAIVLRGAVDVLNEDFVRSLWPGKLLLRLHACPRPAHAMPVPGTPVKAVPKVRKLCMAADAHVHASIFQDTSISSRTRTPPSQSQYARGLCADHRSCEVLEVRVKPHRESDCQGRSDHTKDHEPPFGVETSNWKASTGRRLTESECSTAYYYKYSLHFVVRVKYVAWPRL